VGGGGAGVDRPHRSGATLVAAALWAVWLLIVFVKHMDG